VSTEKAGRTPLLYITGLTGAGKTTLLQQLTGFRAVDFSDLLQQEFGASPETWGALSGAEFAEGVKAAASHLVAERDTVVAGHVFALRHGRRQVIQGAWEAIMPCAAVIWLDVDASRLERRRSLAADAARRIPADRRFAMRFLLSECTQFRTPLMPMPNNTPDDLRKNAVRIRDLAERLLRQ
jgi:shikimate kinase